MGEETTSTIPGPSTKASQDSAWMNQLQDVLTDIIIESKANDADLKKWYGFINAHKNLSVLLGHYLQSTSAKITQMLHFEIFPLDDDIRPSGNNDQLKLRQLVLEFYEAIMQPFEFQTPQSSAAINDAMVRLDNLDFMGGTQLIDFCIIMGFYDQHRASQVVQKWWKHLGRKDIADLTRIQSDILLHGGIFVDILKQMQVSVESRNNIINQLYSNFVTILDTACISWISVLNLLPDVGKFAITRINNILIQVSLTHNALKVDSNGTEHRQDMKRLKWRLVSLLFTLIDAVLDDNGDGKHATIIKDQILSIAESTVIPPNTKSIEPFINCPILGDLQFLYNIKSIFESYAGFEYACLITDQINEMMPAAYRDGASALLSNMSADVNANSVDIMAAYSDKVKHIQELMPHLGAGFIVACLEHYGGDIDATTMGLLDNSLPPSLLNLEQTLDRWPLLNTSTSQATNQDYILNKPRTIFDGDEFDILRRDDVDSSKFYMPTNKPKASDRFAANKLLENKVRSRAFRSAILNAAEDLMDDDEYDDTYDSLAGTGAATDGTILGSETGGDIDEASGEHEKSKKRSKETSPNDKSQKSITFEDPTRLHEAELVSWVEKDKSVFAKGTKSKNLDILRKRTGLTPEQIQGWYIMFKRSSTRKQDKILEKYEWTGNQAELKSTAGAVDLRKGEVRRRKQKSNNQIAPGSATEGNEKSQAQSQQRQRALKENNKARNANHSRKKQHDKKAQAQGIIN
ncbi:hypothetical protein H4219_001799 [Mycoemilia scoparia]|uniref:CUE domain-containing protein n=1 Tax=Mycoemilia scoparia TaxID=417184 RepID=A0A9W8A4W4_9FUNG|nr:hypothetical protein H4219_001799 [Mycoemilia scoparia]